MLSFLIALIVILIVMYCFINVNKLYKYAMESQREVCNEALCTCYLLITFLLPIGLIFIDINLKSLYFLSMFTNALWIYGFLSFKKINFGLSYIMVLTNIITVIQIIYIIRDSMLTK